MQPPEAQRYLGTVLLGRYYVNRLVGKGAFSWVYHGRTKSGDDVAIKVLHADRPAVRARFGREVMVLRSLGVTPNVVRYIEDDRTKDGCPVLVTEFIRGLTLRQVLRKLGPVGASLAVRFAIELCQALESLHALGVVHRDIKPGNVMLERDCEIKLIDFGLVRDAQGILKLLEDEESLSRDGVFAKDIDTGVLSGTFSYMAPEQFADALLEDMSASRTDTYTDVFSIGVILYELLSGQVPFVFGAVSEGSASSATYSGLIRRRLRLGDSDIKPLARIDPALWSIVARSLSHDPDHRPANAQMLHHELNGYLRHGTAPQALLATDTVQRQVPGTRPGRRSGVAPPIAWRKRKNASSELLQAVVDENVTLPHRYGEDETESDRRESDRTDPMAQPVSSGDADLTVRTFVWTTEDTSAGFGPPGKDTIVTEVDPAPSPPEEWSQDLTAVDGVPPRASSKESDSNEPGAEKPHLRAWSSLEEEDPWPEGDEDPTTTGIDLPESKTRR